MTDPVDVQQRFYEGLLESQFWPFERIAEHQRRQLDSLLRHARSNSAFYAGRLSSVFRANGAIDWGLWHDLPLVRRKDLRDHRDAMLATSVPQGHGNVMTSSTSGSSGSTISVSSDRLAALATAANRWRAFHWHGLDCSRIMLALLGGSLDPAERGNVARGGVWGPPWEPRALYGQFLRIDRATPVDRVLEVIAEERPDYLVTGPKVAHALALDVERVGAAVGFDRVLMQGSSASAADRDALRRVFGARPVELYSSKEAGQIAHACPDGHAMHINAESVLVEILDENDRPCPLGKQGKVVVTPLFNFAQPLIRYEQGDVAAFTTCACGRGLPAIDRLIGRNTTLFYHPDGRVRGGLLPDATRDCLDCQGWQVAQIGPLEFEVRYVPRDAAAMGDEAAAAATFRATYFEDAQVSFRRVSEIPLSPAGKPIEYINEFKPI
jgi:phenylacetate-CoA ligase